MTTQNDMPEEIWMGIRRPWSSKAFIPTGFHTEAFEGGTKYLRADTQPDFRALAEMLAGVLKKVHGVMIDDYATIPTEDGYKIDSWKFLLAMAKIDDDIRESIKSYEDAVKEK